MKTLTKITSTCQEIVASIAVSMSRGQGCVRNAPRLSAIHWTKLCRGEIVFSPAAAPADRVRFVRTQQAALLPAAVQLGPAAEFRVATIKDVAREAGVSIATVS